MKLKNGQLVIALDGRMTDLEDDASYWSQEAFRNALNGHQDHAQRCDRESSKRLRRLKRIDSYMRKRGL